MKTFYFNFEDGLEQKYIDWAKEAVQDFINLFPEYKDNFATTERNITYDNLDISILQTLAEQNKRIYEERKNVRIKRFLLSEALFDVLNDWIEPPDFSTREIIARAKEEKNNALNQKKDN